MSEEKGYVPDPPSSTMLYSYICTECKSEYQTTTKIQALNGCRNRTCKGVPIRQGVLIPGLNAPMPEKIEKKEPPRKGFDAWCSQHGCEPSECFTIHYPHAYGKRFPTPEEIRKQVEELHIQKVSEQLEESKKTVDLT